MIASRAVRDDEPMKDASLPPAERRSPTWERATRTPVRRLDEARGSFEVYIPAEGICVSLARGHLSLALARQLPDALAPLLEEGQSFALFNDWKDMTTYDSGARRLLTNWVLANVQRLRSLEFVVGSRIVAMGVAAANVATSVAGLPLVVDHTRTELERALSRVV